MPENRRIRGTTVAVDQAAKKLRKPMTPAEQVLWRAIRNNQVEGVKFRRQHAVDRYILDFYCPECRLVIEVDGDSHLQQEEYDAIRTEYLQAYGYRVMRFHNEEVKKELADVLRRIRQTIQVIRGQGS